jgi:hypothetical protein
MKRITFKPQLCLSLGVLVFSFLLARLFKIGVLYNIGYIIVGLLFALNPVWPQMWDWRDHEVLKKGIRIGGLLIIVIFGLFTAYGV